MNGQHFEILCVRLFIFSILRSRPNPLKKCTDASLVNTFLQSSSSSWWLEKVGVSKTEVSHAYGFFIERAY